MFLASFRLTEKGVPRKTLSPIEMSTSSGTAERLNAERSPIHPPVDDTPDEASASSYTSLDYSHGVIHWKGNDGTIVRIRIENLVYTCNIGTRLHLTHLVRKLSHLGAQLNRRRFAAVIIRLKDPKIAILLFGPGNVVCTGAKNRNQARLHLFNVVEELQKIGYRHAAINQATGGLKIQNMVASAVLPWRLNLSSLATAHSAYCCYEPELFPGIIIRYPLIDNVTFLGFGSGKMVVTGAKVLDDILKGMDKIVPLLKPHISHAIRPNAQTNATNRFIKPIALINKSILQEAKGKTKAKPASPDRTPKEEPQPIPMSDIANEPVQNTPVKVKKLVTVKKEPDTGPVVIQHMPNLFSMGEFSKKCTV